jgi:P-type Cu+ transporter
VARRLGIEEVVLPDQKSGVVERLKRQGRTVAMARDGVTLIKGDLTGIVRARRLSEATMRNIRQNLFFAFVYNSSGVPIAAGVLYPFLGILLSPVLAAAAMALSSVSVIGNSLRLRTIRL